MSGYHPELDAIATQYNEVLWVHGFTLNSTDERSGGLDLFIRNPRQDEENQQKWVPVSSPGCDGPMRFWPPVTVADILAYAAKKGC